MFNKNIYKVDGYFIVIGIVFLALGTLGIALDPRTYSELVITKKSGNTTNVSFDDLRGRTIEQVLKEQNDPSAVVVKTVFPIIRTAMVINGVVLLIVGIIYRKKEKKIISIWNAIEIKKHAKIDELAVSLGLSRDFILNNIKRINSQPGAFYVYDSSNDTIVDGRLQNEYPIAIVCQSCGANNEQKITISLLASPKCLYCGSIATSSSEFAKLKEKLLVSTVPNSSVANQQQKNFNVGIFILLLFLFWPGAIYYVVKNSSK